MSEVTYFSTNSNGEAETVKILLKARAKLKKRCWEFDFGLLGVKNRASLGNIVTKYPVHKITKVTSGISTLGGLKIWFDQSIMKLNTDGRGEYIGEFSGEDKSLSLVFPKMLNEEFLQMMICYYFVNIFHVNLGNVLKEINHLFYLNNLNKLAL